MRVAAADISGWCGFLAGCKNIHGPRWVNHIHAMPGHPNYPAESCMHCAHPHRDAHTPSTQAGRNTRLLAGVWPASQPAVPHLNTQQDRCWWCWGWSNLQGRTAGEPKAHAGFSLCGRALVCCSTPAHACQQAWWPLWQAQEIISNKRVCKRAGPRCSQRNCAPGRGLPHPLDTPGTAAAARWRCLPVKTCRWRTPSSWSRRSLAGKLHDGQEDMRHGCKGAGRRCG